MAEKKTAGQTAPKEEVAPAAPAEVKSLRVPKDGIVKPADLGPIADAFIAYKFPEDAQQVNGDSKYGQKNTKTGKLEVTGYRSQYIINALNEIIGPGNWREYGTEEVEKPATAFVTVYRGTFEIGNWKSQVKTKIIKTTDGTHTTETELTPYFEVLAQFSQTGGSRNMDKWESMKGARTNFLKKVCSYLSNGWRAYALVMDEDFQSLPPEVEKPTPAARPIPPKTAGEEPKAPATANAKLITMTERDIIYNLFNRMGYAPEEVPARMKALEERIGKTLAEFTQGEARDTIKKMEAHIAKQEVLPPEEREEAAE